MKDIVLIIMWLSFCATVISGIFITGDTSMVLALVVPSIITLFTKEE